jgi:hypothetical protein
MAMKHCGKAELVLEIAENLESALDSFREIIVQLKK